MLWYIAGYDPIHFGDSRVYWFGAYLNEEDAEKRLKEFIQKYNMDIYVNNCYKSRTGFICWMRSMPLGDLDRINPSIA